jgi:fructuronate reductase
MRRLSEASLASLPPSVARPRYDRRAVTCGIVHLGIGAFHRAHQAVFYDDALNAGDLRWGVTGASLRSPDVRDQLTPQDGLYTLLTRNGDAQEARIVGAVQSVLVAPEAPQALVAAISAPETHIVSLTITEKGYALDPATGALNTDDPAIAHDLRALHAPKSAIGFLVAGLQRRRRNGLGPITIVSCDNLPHNGDRTRKAVLSFAAIQDDTLAVWIEAEVAFPSTMVDRIVPATTAEDVAALASSLGVEDRGMVKTEPFSQWVIEDSFAAARPDFASLGVQLTSAVAPWEEAKLRLLNGSHSAIAYLGALAGHEYVAEAIAAPGFAQFVSRLMDEAEATLSPPRELDVPRYRADLLARFGNAALRHRTRQIAMDGSQKIPQRLLNAIRSRLRSEAAFPALALALAAWIRWQLGRDETGAAFVVDDPLAPRTAKLLAGASDAAAMVAAVVSLESVFGQDLPREPRFVSAVESALRSLLEQGAAVSVLALPEET